MKRNILIGISMIIMLMGIVSAYQLTTIYNPFSGKLDYIVTSNFSGDNVTANNFFGNLIGTWNSSSDYFTKTEINAFDWINNTLGDLRYYGINNPFSFYNSTIFDYNNYYLKNNPFSFYNSTDFSIVNYYNSTETDTEITNANTSMKSYTDGTFITQANEGNLNVNDSDYLDGYDSTYFMPLNTSVSGQFDFNGGWTSDGLSIIDGDIYAQTGYFYNITGLDVSTIKINGSIVPQAGFDNQFDIGEPALRWRSGYFGNSMNVNGTGYFGGNVGIGTTSPDAKLDVDGDLKVTGDVNIYLG